MTNTNVQTGLRTIIDAHRLNNMAVEEADRIFFGSQVGWEWFYHYCPFDSVKYMIADASYFDEESQHRCIDDEGWNQVLENCRTLFVLNVELELDRKQDT